MKSTKSPLIAYGGRVLASLASADTSDGLAYRYAIAELVPFAVTGDPEIYASHNSDGELDLYDPASGQGNLTEQYLKDRAAMLSWKIRFDTGAPDINDPLTPRADKPYAEEWDSWISGDWDFVDLASGIKLTIDGWDLSTTANHQIVFGSRNADILLGDQLSDNLYGGAGDDTLIGKDGNDYLEGGQGYDTYIFNTGDGHDTLLDSDGQGIIVIDGVEAKGRNGLSPDGWERHGTDSWTDPQNSIVYVLYAVGDGAQNLRISKGDASVTIRNWKPGDFGIEIGAGIPPALPATDLSITGDLTPIDFNPTEPGVQTQADDLGNVIVSGEAMPGRADYLQDGAGNDHLLGLDGDDFLYAWRGGDNILEGGAGSDILISKGGADRLYADDKIDDLDVAMLLGDTDIGTGFKGDLLGSGDGDDIVVGSQGNDTLLGGGGDDVISELNNDNEWRLAA
jgi:Ca2+-binding RTX toxin-like protein